jgi:hypothetical protein
VGRPKKRPEDKYVTPPKSWRPPPELYERVKRKGAERGDSITAILTRALEDYDRKHEEKP